VFHFSFIYQHHILATPISCSFTGWFLCNLCSEMAGRLHTLGLYVLFLKVVLFLSVEPVRAARQHCRLEPRDQTAFHTPGGGAAPSNSTTTKPATTSQGRPVSSPSPSPTPSPFRYGSDTVRGVNLWVIVDLPD
jgi:hypothetical protein